MCARQPFLECGRSAYFHYSGKKERLFLWRACGALAEVVRTNHFGVSADWPVSIILEKRNDCSFVGRVLPWLSVCAPAIVGLRPVGLFPLFWKKGTDVPVWA